MKSLKPYILPVLAAFLILTTSCIRDALEPCPPLTVKIGIEDKNYFNIDEIERATGLDHRLPEDQPFRYYIQKLYYSLYSVDRKEIVMTKHLHEVEGDAQLATAYLPEDLPFGTYVLVVWGNIDSEDGIVNAGGEYDLHRDRVEGYDVYMTCDTLVFDEWNYDYTVMLQRVKGKLLIEGVGIPSEINWSRKAVTGVSGNVDYAMNYTDEETVVTESAWSPEDEHIVTDTYLAPTVTEKSMLYVRFFDDEAMETPVSAPRDVDIMMNRNEITVLRYVYDAGSGTFDIYTLVNDSWQVIHDMVLE